MRRRVMPDGLAVPRTVPEGAGLAGGPMRAPSFYLTGRQTLGPGSILLATVLAAAAMGSVMYALKHNAHAMRAGEDAGRSGGTAGAPKTDDKDDDPNQVDTIVLGDPSDAPVPARKGDHVSPVHATILVRLPRFGDQVGLIPDSAAGRLLYGWLAAFNHASYPELGNALPSMALSEVASAEMALRKQTGGFALLSAVEVTPGVLVFRLRDQTPAAGETLGSLRVVPGSNPPRIGSFSLRTVARAGQTGAESATAAPEK